MTPETETLYQTLIMERARHPLHAGRPAMFDAEGHGDNPLCGDRIDLFIAGGEVFHQANGCAIMLASADLMADAVAGMAPAQIEQCRAAFTAVVTTGVADPSLGALNALAGVADFRSRIRCATLPWSALAEAVNGSALADAVNGPALAEAVNGSALAEALENRNNG